MRPFLLCCFLPQLFHAVIEMHLQILHGHLRAGDIVHQGSQLCHRAINIKAILTQLAQQRHQV
nr:MAG TPA: hypothetical protein [Caudoviricetes sp.]